MLLCQQHLTKKPDVIISTFPCQETKQLKFSVKEQLKPTTEHATHSI